MLVAAFVLSAVSYGRVQAAGVGLSKKKVTLAAGKVTTVKLTGQGKWKITKAASSKKAVVVIKKRTKSAVKIRAVKKGTAKLTIKVKNSVSGKSKKLFCTVTVQAKKEVAKTPEVTSVFTTEPSPSAEAVVTPTPVPATEPTATPEADDSFEKASEGAGNIIAGWNVGNALDSDSPGFMGTVEQWETLWGSPVITKGLIQEMKKAGFNAIRIPVTWEGHMDREGKVDSAWMKRVEEVVDYCIDEDMYTIINVHHDCGGSKTKWLRADLTEYDAINTKFKKLWLQIAENFKEYGEKLLFEGYNELLDKDAAWTSTDADGYEAQNRLAQSFVDTVRSTGGNNAVRNLIVSTYSADARETSVKNFILPSDEATDHLIVEVHCYMPDSFTTDADWLSVNETEFTEAAKQELDQTFERLDQAFVSKGIPVIIGEYGAQDKKNDEERAKYAYYFAYHAKQHGIAAFWWDNSADMGIIDRKTFVWTQPEIRDGIIGGSTGK